MLQHFQCHVSYEIIGRGIFYIRDFFQHLIHTQLTPPPPHRTFVRSSSTTSPLTWTSSMTTGRTISRRYNIASRISGGSFNILSLCAITVHTYSVTLVYL